MMCDISSWNFCGSIIEADLPGERDANVGCDAVRYLDGRRLAEQRAGVFRWYPRRPAAAGAERHHGAQRWAKARAGAQPIIDAPSAARTSSIAGSRPNVER